VSQLNARDGILETTHFKVKFDLQRGGIASLVDKVSGHELVDPTTHVLGQFLHQRFDNKDVAGYVNVYHRLGGNPFPAAFGKDGMPGDQQSPHADQVPGPWKMTATRDAVGNRVVLTCQNTLGLAESYTLTFVFPVDRACVDIDWEVKNKTPNTIPEGGWLCVPLAIQQPVFRVGEVGGSINPVKDIIVGGNRDILAADRAITVRAGDSGAGAGVASTNLPLWSLGEPGLWKYSDDYVPTKPEVFANLYNNQWSTNYPMWIGGSWKASLRVWPVADGATEEQAVFTPAWELRQGLVAGYASGGAGKLPVTQTGLTLSRKGVRVTEFAPDLYSSGTLLRVWEQAGTGGKIDVTLPPGMKITKAQPVDLRGQKLGSDIPVLNGRFAFDLGAWTPASFVLN
jgi:hypothetical protein